jgi:hypothetical protein
MTIPMISPEALPPVTVLVTSTEILASGAIPQGGQHATLQAYEYNTEPVWLGFGVPAVLGMGPALHPGQQWNITPANFHQGSINGISASGGQVVRLSAGASGLGPHPDLQRSDGLLTFSDPNTGEVNKFGRSINVDSGINTDVWDGSKAALSTPIWVPPTAARIHAVTSGHVDDTAAGPGAQAVEVQGLDASWAMQSETVELAGAGSVNTVGSYIRVFRAKVVRVGANGYATNDITITAAVDATITAAILTPNNQSLMAIWTVPANYTAYVTQYYSTLNRASPAAVSCDICMFAKPAADVATSPWQLKHIRGMFSAGNSSASHRFNPWYKFEEKTDIKMQATDCNANDTDVSAGFDVIMVAN